MRHLWVLGLLLSAHAVAAPPATGPYGLEPETWDAPDQLKPEPEPNDAEVQVLPDRGRRENRLSYDVVVDRRRDWRPPDNLQGHWRLAGGIGVRWGTFLVDNVDTGTNTQGHAELGARKGRVWLAAEYALTSVTLPADTLVARSIDPLRTGDIDGLVHRLGGFVRYSISRLGCRDVGFDVYLEGGAGVEHLRWDAGGAWTRPDVSFGVGTGMWVAEDDGHGGVTVGLRVTLAPRNDVAGATATCAGPCDHATPPTGVDRSFLFDITIPFGR